MIEEQARVLDAKDGYAWVETQRRSTCSSCSAASQGCGTGLLERVLGQRRARLRVLDPLGTHSGEQVVIGIEDRTLLRSSLAAYLAPLLALLLGALGGGALAPLLGWSAEACSTLTGIAGLLLSIVWLSRHARGMQRDRRYQPVVLRRAVPVFHPH